MFLVLVVCISTANSATTPAPVETVESTPALAPVGSIDDASDNSTITRNIAANSSGEIFACYFYNIF